MLESWSAASLLRACRQQPHPSLPPTPLLPPTGVGWAMLETPAGRLSVFNTHLSANYGQQWQAGAHALAPDCRLPRDSLAGVRLLQVGGRPGTQGRPGSLCRKAAAGMLLATCASGGPCKGRASRIHTCSSPACRRVQQMLELAAFVRARGGGSPGGVVLAGDLNSSPGTLEQALLRVGSQAPALWVALQVVAAGDRAPAASLQPSAPPQNLQSLPG